MPHSDFPRPYSVQFRGSSVARWLLRRLGWQVQFEGLPALQGVMVVYPHTSNWDFVIGVLAKWSLGLPVHFWGKDSLFRVPLFGRWLRWLGGVPIDRTSSRGVVAETTAQLAHARAQGEYYWLALAPEGTRKRTPGWRSGFYRTAVQAQVPLGLARLDYGRREIRVLDFIRLTGQESHDVARMVLAYEGVQGCRPNQASPIQLSSSDRPIGRESDSR